MSNIQEVKVGDKLKIAPLDNLPNFDKEIRKEKK